MDDDEDSGELNGKENERWRFKTTKSSTSNYFDDEDSNELNTTAKKWWWLSDSPNLSNSTSSTVLNDFGKNMETKTCPFGYTQDGNECTGINVFLFCSYLKIKYVSR